VARVPTVLLVDDEPDMLFLLRLELASDEWELVEAVDYVAGSERALATGPSVAVLDYMLPDGSGLALAGSVRVAAPACFNILFTAHAGVEAEALRHPAVDRFLHKDRVGELRALIADVLHSKA
jgi:DNA-binding response OmpR family regulator